MAAVVTSYQAKYFAHELARNYANDQVGKLAGLLFDAQVEPKPHQIDAALFVLQTPFLPGVILADEVGLGKTIEAGIVISQYWAERRRRILIVTPSSLRQQWQQELMEKFLIPSTILDSGSASEVLSHNGIRPQEVLICSYDFVVRHESDLVRPWDLVVSDEAHRLRNFWKKSIKSANVMARISRGSHKTVLLTATPLQNRLEELFGLVSIFDPEYFYSLNAFRERYVKNSVVDDDAGLAQRVATISKRTLRKDADKYIHFTERLPLTVEFMPSPEEIELYDAVNEYLQRDTLWAFSQSQRHLAALIVRKRLGSSTFAVASTLERVAARLRDQVAAGGVGLLADDDRAQYQLQGIGGRSLEPANHYNAPASLGAPLWGGDEVTSDLSEAFERSETQHISSHEGSTANDAVPASETPASASPSATVGAPGVLRAMSAEAEELEAFAALARSITVNQKAAKLAEALDAGFERLRELGAPEKAIIFTDSTVTQRYIAETLTSIGRGEGLVLFNGSNNAPEQTVIYQAWLEKNEGGDVVTGIPAVDRRKALVDYFRDEGSIMVATEAAAEGINLQFCSMLVNYDLPWNPQRVEQRIGRVHRFGQQHNVVVVNFFNKGNVAEQRILELLTDKFKLFSQVFGASDEVLGSIEDGVDFEGAISDILNRCKTAEELDAAFEQLEAEYAPEISSELARAKVNVFDNLDPHVQDRLKAYDADSEAVLTAFERLLLAVTRRELDEYAAFEGDGRAFTLHRTPRPGIPAGEYFFKSQPRPHAHQFRFNSDLGQWVVSTAQNESTQPRELVFSIGSSTRVSSAVKALGATSGVMDVKLVSFRMKARGEDLEESYLLAGAVTDAGEWLDEEYVNDILELACTGQGEELATVDVSSVKPHLEERLAELENDVQSRNARYFDEQEELAYSNIEDRRAEHDALIAKYRLQENAARRVARNSQDATERIRAKKETRRWMNKISEAEQDFHTARMELEAKMDENLVLMEQALRGTRDVQEVFSIRWKLVP